MLTNDIKISNEIIERLRKDFGKVFGGEKAINRTIADKYISDKLKEQKEETFDIED